MNTQSEGIEIRCAENCGNSPKKELLRDLAIAYVKRDFSFCTDWLTDDVVWDIVGEQRIQGIDDVEQALLQRIDRDVQALHIENIITHGNTGSINGAICLSGEQSVAFCNVYNFRGFGKTAKIKAITSYIIQHRTL